MSQLASYAGAGLTIMSLGVCGTPYLTSEDIQDFDDWCEVGIGAWARLCTLFRGSFAGIEGIEARSWHESQ